MHIEEILALSILFLVAVYLFLFPIRIYKFWDEIVYISTARFLDRGAAYHELYIRGPLLPMLILGAGKISAQYQAVISNVLVSLVCASAVFPLYFTGRMIGGKLNGILACLFFISSFMVQSLSHQIMTDLPSAVLLCYVFLFILMSNRKPVFPVLAGIFLALSFLMRLGTVIAVPLVLLTALFHIRKKRRVLYLFAASGAAVLPYLAWVFMNYGTPLYTLEQGRKAMSVNIEISRILHHLWGSVGSSFYAGELLANVGPFILGGVALALLFLTGNLVMRFSGKPGINHESEKTVFLLLGWAAFFYGYLVYMQWKEPRYLVQVYWQLYLAAGWGFSETIRFFSAGVNPERRFLVRSFKLLFLAMITAFFFRSNFLFSDKALERNYRIDRLFSIGESLTNEKKRVDPVTYNDFSVRLSRVLLAELSKRRNTLLYLNDYYPLVAYYTDYRPTRQIQGYLHRDMTNSITKHMPKPGLVYIEKSSRYPPQFHFALSNRHFKLVREAYGFGIFEYDPAVKMTNTNAVSNTAAVKGPRF